MSISSSGAPPLAVTAFIPVKSLHLGKSRLSGTLNLQERIQLTYESLRHIVHALKSVARVGKIVIISRDPQVAEWADWWQVLSLAEEHAGLNPALRDARAIYGKTAAILVLPSDLAAVSATDIEGMIDAASHTEHSVVIAPDRHGSGTNALMLKPPNIIDFDFGAQSAARHAAAARTAGVEPVIFSSVSISLDLDSPDDYELYWDQW
jgi:2-phospho-L-lactate guanylyltransferase